MKSKNKNQDYNPVNLNKYKIKRPILLTSLISIFAVLIISALILFYFANLNQSISLSPISSVTYSGLPQGFSPTLGYYHALGGSGKIGLWNANGVGYVSSNGINFNPVNKVNLGLPSDFKPTVGYYNPYGVGRVYLWDAIGRVYVSNAQYKFIPLDKSTLKLNGISGAMKTFVPFSGYYHGKINNIQGYGEGVTLWDINGNGYVSQDGINFLLVPANTNNGLPSKLPPKIGYFYNFNGKQEVHLLYNFKFLTPGYNTWRYVFNAITNGKFAFTSTAEVPRDTSIMTLSAGYYDKIRGRVVLWYGSEAYESFEADNKISFVPYWTTKQLKSIQQTPTGNSGVLLNNGQQVSFTTNTGDFKAIPSACNEVIKGDVDGDGAIDSVDVQKESNALLGLEVGCDINKDGKIDSTDLQIVINSALGIIDEDSFYFGFGDYSNGIRDRNLEDEFADSGATWSSVKATWNFIQPTKESTFNFAGGDYDLDKTVNNPNNINIIIRIEADAPWAVSGGGFEGQYWSSGDFKLNDEEAYKNFLRTLVSRYKNKVKYWRIENEPDFRFAKINGVWNVNAQNYVTLLRIASQTIKEADPNAKIIYTTNIANHVFLPDLNEYKGIDAIIELGGLPYVDILDIHFYGSFDYEWKLSTYDSIVTFKDYISNIKSKLDNAGRGNMPIIMTETGVGTGPFKHEGETDFDIYKAYLKIQKAEIVKRNVFALKFGIKIVFWNLFRDMEWYQSRCTDVNDWTCDGIITSDVYLDNNLGAIYNNQPKESYYNYKYLTQTLAKTSFIREEELEAPIGTYAYYFENQDKLVVVIWREIGDNNVPNYINFIINGIFKSAEIISAVTLQSDVYSNYIISPQDSPTPKITIYGLSVSRDNPVYIILNKK